MKFNTGDIVIIKKSIFGDLNLVIGKRGIIRHCWGVSQTPKPWEREKPEYEVEVDDKHFIVLEEELA